MGLQKSTLSFVESEGIRMARREEIEKMAEELVLPILEANKCELVDVEYVKEAGTWYLRVYADKENGITVDDCEVISRAFSDLLDEKDFIEDSYILEVSSPGLGRALKKEKDFARSIGQEVDVHLFKPLNKEKEFTGVLKSYDEDTLTIETEDGEEMQFSRKEIALVRLSFTF